MNRLALVLPLVLVVACGGSSGPSKADYIARAEAICKKANADVKALPFPTSTAAISDYAAKIVAVADETTTALGKLDQPAADKDDLEKKVLAPLRTQVSEGKEFAAKIKAAVDANDQKTLQQLVAKPPVGTEADLDWMRTYGFTQCVDTAKTDG